MTCYNTNISEITGIPGAPDYIFSSSLPPKPAIFYSGIPGHRLISPGIPESPDKSAAGSRDPASRDAKGKIPISNIRHL